LLGLGVEQCLLALAQCAHRLRQGAQLGCGQAVQIDRQVLGIGVVRQRSAASRAGQGQVEQAPGVTRQAAAP